MPDASMETTNHEGMLAGEVQPVKRPDVTGLVIDRLRSLLEKGILQPGSKLPPEAKMSRMFGISRPSLRQAYKALNVLGIIRAVPGDGTYISESTSQALSMPLTFLMLMKKITLEQVFEFRLLLEGELATMAASRASEEELLAMHAQLEQMSHFLNDEKRARYLEAEYEFHNCIARGAHNALLLEIISIISGLLWETRKKLVELVPDLNEDLQAHRDIYLAVSSNEPQAAGDAMRRHLKVAFDLFKAAAVQKSSGP